MTKISLTLAENKTKADLTLDSKGQDYTWDTIPGTWDDHSESTWDSLKQVSSLETKTKADLSLETK